MDNDNLFPEIELAPAYKQNKLTKRNDVIQEYKELHQLLDDVLNGQYNKTVVDQLPVLEAFKIHIETPLGTYHNFYRKKELDEWLNEHHDIDADTIKNVAEFKNHSVMNYIFDRFINNNLSHKASPTYLKIFQDHLFGRKISDCAYNRINEVNVQNVNNNNFVIQNYRDEVPNSNTIAVCSKQSLKDIELSESQARRDFENRSAAV